MNKSQLLEISLSDLLSYKSKLIQSVQGLSNLVNELEQEKMVIQDEYDCQKRKSEVLGTVFARLKEEYKAHKRSEMPIHQVTEVQTPREYKLVSNMLLERETLQNKVMLNKFSPYKVQNTKTSQDPPKVLKKSVTEVNIPRELKAIPNLSLDRDLLEQQTVLNELFSNKTVREGRPNRLRIFEDRKVPVENIMNNSPYELLKHYPEKYGISQGKGHSRTASASTTDMSEGSEKVGIDLAYFS